MSHFFWLQFGIFPHCCDPDKYCYNAPLFFCDFDQGFIPWPDTAVLLASGAVWPCSKCTLTQAHAVHTLTKIGELVKADNREGTIKMGQTNGRDAQEGIMWLRIDQQLAFLLCREAACFAFGPMVCRTAYKRRALHMLALQQLPSS